MFIARFGCKDGISLSYQLTPTTCPTGTNGKLLAIPSEVNSWSYQWDGQNATGETTPQVSGLIDSVKYFTTITSPGGCAYNDSIIMTHKPALQVNLEDSITVKCLASNDGIATIIPSAGNITGDSLTSDYHYIWDDGNTDSLRTDLTVGIHIVTISDLCEDTTQIIDTVKVGHIPTLQAYVQNQNVIVLCDTSTNGVGRVIYQDGVSPYTFQWENSNTPNTSDVAHDLNVGLHHVTITDFCNVPIIDSVRIVNVPTIGAQITEIQNATCSGMTNGQATVTVYNGVEPYNYQWSASASDTSFANDLPGDSIIYVTVSDICHERIDSVHIGVNPQMEISIDNIVNARCLTTNDGSANINLTNQQGNITYQWSASASDSAIANDLPGDSTVYITVTDMCGPKTDSVYIGVNPAKEITFINIQNANCNNSADGQAEAVITYGQDTVTYLWSSGDTLALATTLNGGYAYLTVTDLCGPIVDSVLIGVEPALQVTTDIQNNKCNSDSTGSITLNLENQFGPIQYIWANLSDTTQTIDSLSAGTYYFTVIDACNDTVRDSAVVVQPLALTDSVIITKASDLNTNNGSILLIVAGGTPTYNYDWSNGNITSENTNLMAGTYYYTISDANNCSITDSVVVEAEKYDVVIYNTFTPNGDGVNDVWNIKNIEHFPDAEVKIFGQWGNEVFVSEKGYPKAWDGTNNGKELPAGTYYYIIKLDDDTPDKSGYVTIVK
jgi:gliding motility-associated-like protein